MAQFDVNTFGRSFAGGLQTGQQVQQMGRQNALADLYREQGAGIMQGDPGALNALAQFDPMQALGVRNALSGERRADEAHGMNTTLTREKIDQIRMQSAQAMKAEAARLSEAERAAERQQLSGIVSGARQAIVAGPEAWEQFKASIPPDMWQGSGIDPASLTYETAPAALAMVVGMLEGVSDATEFSNSMGPSGADTEAEREIGRLMETGYSREQAIGLKEGVLGIFTDPVTRETTLINKITGEIVQPTGGGQTQTQQPQPAQAQPPAQQQPPQPELTFGNDIPTGGEQAFGVGGLVRRGANFVSDAMGAGEVFPEAAEQQRFFRVLEEDLLVGLSQAYGRQPAQQLMERLRALVPQSGTMEGASAARGELSALKRRFERDLENARNNLGQRLSPGDRTEIMGQISGLQSSLGTINEALTRLGGSGGGSGNTTSSGINWSIED